ncbi:aromatic di-alanine and TPR containing protein [Ceratobasidium sp. AG-Ba]|nr:aromatic di-alanine and TPR containing protein [Ceratobasidium sp. AG-Ba]
MTTPPTSEIDPMILVNRISKLDVAERGMTSSDHESSNQTNENTVEELSECTQAVMKMTSEDREKVPLLRSLANISWRRFRRLNKLEDLDRVIICGDQLVESSPNDDPEKPQRLNTLSIAYQNRFERLGETTDIESSIVYRTQALDLTPGLSAHRIAMMTGLGNAYLSLYEHQGSLEDLDKALAILHQVVLDTPENDPNLSTRLNNLGLSYQSRFEYFGRVEDLESALKYINRSVQLAPENHPSKPKWLNNLGISLHSRFELLGDVQDLEQSLACKEEALMLTDDDDPDKPARLSNLSISYQSQFEQQGRIESIDKAIKHAEIAVSLIENNKYLLPIVLTNLGSSYRHRFERLGEASDLDRAIKHDERALEMTGDHLVGNHERLNNLGNAYLCRFELLGHTEDIQNAIAFQEKAVLATPDGHPNKPRFLSSLGKSCLRQFQLEGEHDYASRAVGYHRQALEILGAYNHPDIPSELYHLALVHMSLFDRFGRISDIDKAIDLQKQAIERVPKERFTLTGWLWNLGNSYMHRYEKMTKSADLDAAIENYKEAAKSSAGSPAVRLQATLSWARVARFLNDSSLEAYRIALDMIPQIAWLGSSINHRYAELTKDLGKIASEAAAAAIQESDYALALEWLEEGRSIVWNQLLRLRTSFDSIYSVDARIAIELERVGQELGRSVSNARQSAHTPQSSVYLENDVQQQHELAAKWDSLLDEARCLPGLQNFLKPKSYSELVLAAKASTIIVINLYKERCDALVLTPQSSEPTHIPLPAFSEEKALEIHRRIVASHSNYGVNKARRPKFKPEQTDSSFEVALGELWDYVVKVVLENLGYLDVKDEAELPHIIWCTTGQLAFLPLHAAGRYGNGPARAFDYVVSSYTPTIIALLDSKKPLKQFCGILLVGQEAASGSEALPGTVIELDKVQNHRGDLNLRRLEGENATDLFDPLKSSFQLYDGSLYLSDISGQSLEHADFAFLSACETATGHHDLPDEAVHLAAGMLILGFSHVIATMWSIKDEDAPIIADHIYADIIPHGVPDSEKSARALHRAVVLHPGMRVSPFEDIEPWVDIELAKTGRALLEYMYEIYKDESGQQAGNTTLTSSKRINRNVRGSTGHVYVGGRFPYGGSILIWWRYSAGSLEISLQYRLRVSQLNASSLGADW